MAIALRWDMEQATDKKLGANVRRIVKALLCAYISTGVLMVLMAVLSYKFDLESSKMAIGIIIICILANFLGGYVAGKCMREKKYIWGMLVGILYVLLLIIITLGVNGTLSDGNFATTLVLCVCSGGIGGMLA